MSWLMGGFPQREVREFYAITGSNECLKGAGRENSNDDFDFPAKLEPTSGELATNSFRITTSSDVKVQLEISLPNSSRTSLVHILKPTLICSLSRPSDSDNLRVETARDFAVNCWQRCGKSSCFSPPCARFVRITRTFSMRSRRSGRTEVCPWSSSGCSRTRG